MAISRTLVEAVRSRIAQNPALSTGSLALELDSSESDVITALPLAMRRKAKPRDLPSIWSRMTAWKHPQVSTENGKNKASLPSGLPKGSVVGGRFTLDYNLPLIGNGFSVDDLAQIWFVSQPGQDGSDNYSVRFFNPRGRELFTVAMGRNGQGRVSPAEHKEFESMRQEFGVVPVPRNRCHGCGKCTCGQKKTAA